MQETTHCRFNWWLPCIVTVFLALTVGRVGAQPAEVLRLCDFEDEGALDDWEYRSGAAEIVETGATHGAGALQITFDPAGQYQPGYIYWNEVHRDWSGYDALILDVYNPNDRPTAAYVLIADQAWADTGRSYWNRHNAQRTFAPGQSEWVIPVQGLYRGEAGSRNNDIKRNIDSDSIVRVDFGFGAKGTSGRIIIDNLRLVEFERAAGAWAFDFGPPSQAAMVGWTAVDQNTEYTAERGFGWGPRGGTPWNGAARDTTFGTSLIRDFCEAGGYRFHVDVPPGRYRVLVIYENCGYWGGEQARHTVRRIYANEQVMWADSRPDGWATALYRFEDTDPVGADIWDTYMEPEIARPIVFAADADENGITFRFEADQVWGSKVSALALHEVSDREGRQWIDDQLRAVEEEFRQSAVCLDEPAEDFAPDDEWEAKGLVAWPVAIEDTVQPNTVPPNDAAGPTDLELERLAVRGEYEPFCVAVRPLRDLGTCSVEFEGFAGAEGIATTVSVVHYNTSRGFGTIAYRIMPHTVRNEGRMELEADVTRQIIVTAHVPADVSPGQYEGEIKITDASGAELLGVPVRLRVSPVTLDRDSEFLMGFFGLMPPRMLSEDARWRTLDGTLAILRGHGMNAVSGGPSWQLTGWEDGEPIIDYGQVDRFFELLRKHGFTLAVNGYGGLRFNGLHERYQKGDVAEKVEQESGLPYEEAFVRAWQAVHEHAREHNWPTIFYAMCDETRVRRIAEAELEFMKLMGKVSAKFPETVQTSGAYSVSFEEEPTDKDDLQYWHQRFFENLDVSSLNLHDETVMERARELDKQIHIYNQGRSRYSFGLYQFSEFMKGVRARWQWHLNILHGYQFFDLDGREPDTAMLCYGRDELYPTIHFERCREGAEDFYLYNTLRKLVEEQEAAGEADEAVQAGAELLNNVVGNIKLNQRGAPEGFDADELKAEVVAAIEGITETG